MLPKMTKGWGMYEFAVHDYGVTNDFFTQFDRLVDALNARVDRLRDLKSAKRNGRHVLSIFRNDGFGRAVYHGDDVEAVAGNNAA